MDQEICTDCGELHKYCDCDERNTNMTAQKYLLSMVTDNNLFKIRDAVDTLAAYGLADVFIRQDVYAEIEKRTATWHMGVKGWSI